MDGPTLFAELKKILAALYGEPADARRVASDAGLDLAHIPFDAKAINTWHNILAVAIRSGALTTVVEIALGEYARHQPLVLIGETYRHFIAAGGQLDAPPLLEAKTTLFDQQGQKVTYQVNVAGDLHVGPAPTRRPKALSAKIPRLAPDKIVGRAEDLADLRQRLVDQRQVVLVNGMGGIGKTTLAQVYVAQYWDEYHHLLWISQTSRDVVNDFVYTEGLVENLGLHADGQDAKALFIQIMTALQTITDQPNLLVIDNAESTLGDLYDYLPAQPQWHILVTARQSIEKFDRKELDFLGEAAAIELFLRHYTLGKIAPAAIKSLVHAVDLHTLTIEILSKTAQTQRTAIHDLQQAIAADLRANVYIPHKGEKIDRVTAYLCSMFMVSRLPAQEQWLLKQFTCLPAEFHPYDLVEALINPAASQNAAIFAETLEALTAAGWLLKHQATDSYKLHRIIADVVKKQTAITVTDVEPLIEQVTARLAIDQSQDNPIDKFPWIPFGQALLALFLNSDLPTLATLQNNLALVLQALGDYAGAKALLDQAVRAAEKNFGSDHPTTAVRYSNLAVVLQALGDYAGAKALLAQALRTDEKHFGPHHPTTALSSSNLAMVLKDLGDYAGAKALLDQAVRADEKHFGPDHPTTARSSSNLALVLQALGDYAGAKALLDQAVRADEKHFGPHHPTTAGSYSNLATVLQDLGDYAGAKALLDQAVRANEKHFGPDHPTTAVSYSNLAVVLRDLGDYAGAKALLDQAVRADEKHFGPDHPTTAVSYSNLALVLQDLGDYAGAKDLLQQAVRAAEKNFGPDHPATAVRYSNLAVVLQALGDYAGAQALLQQAVRADEKNFGPDHPATAVSYSNLALVLQDLGDYAGAKDLLQQAVVIVESRLGSSHPNTNIVRNNLAAVIAQLAASD